MIRFFIALLLLAVGVSAGNAQSVDFDAEAIPTLVGQIEDCLTRPWSEMATMYDCINAGSKPCLDTPGNDTTFAMRACTSNGHLAWDAILNNRYKSLRSVLPDDQFGVLRDAQRAWIKYRDADCSLAGKAVEGGTLEPLLIVSCYERLTAVRAIELDEMFKERRGL